MKTNCSEEMPVFVIPTDEENSHFEKLDKSYEVISEMTGSERLYLNALIRRHRPQKIVEIGVAAGASSLIMLNALQDIEGSKLYSIDYNTPYYKDSEKKTGYFVDNYPELKNKWELRTGGLTLEFIEEIGGGIDFCLIDTMHVNPGEILDFLMVLPFLKDDAVVVFHDANFHTTTQKYTRIWGITNNLLMSSIYGIKLLQGNFIDRSSSINTDGLRKPNFANIGGIKLKKETKSHVWEIFNLLTIHWRYLLSSEDYEKVLAFIGKYYCDYVEYFENVYRYHQQRHSL